MSEVREILKLMNERDQLKAEIEQLKAEVDWQSKVNAIQAEEMCHQSDRADQLKAEVERLKDVNAIKERDMYKAFYETSQQERDELRAMCEKLAETLTEAVEDLENLGHTAIAADLRRQTLFEETKE